MSKVVGDEGMRIIWCPGCEEHHGLDARWAFNGDFEKPTFSPSLLYSRLTNGVTYVCHSFIRDGNIEFLNDCSHALAGKVVPLDEP